jgi:hypothetical protein
MSRAAIEMSRAEKLAMLLESLESCPTCKRIVVVYQINTSRVVMDPLPGEREAIVRHLGDRFTGFSVRTPMMSGQPPARVREAHECTVPAAEPHPERGWKPRPGHNADIYDGG